MNINYVKNGKNEFETTKLIDKYDNKKFCHTIIPIHM